MPVIFNTLLSRVKSIYSPGTRLVNQTSTIPTPNRHNLAHQIENSLDTDRPILDQLEETIEETKITVHEMEQSERFLDTRIRKYRKMLADHLVRVDALNHAGEDSNDSAHSHPSTSSIDRAKHVQQQEKYQLKICDVMDVHRNILAEVETMRRRLRDLEVKRDDLIYKRDECEEFLVASARLDLEGGDEAEHLRAGCYDDDDDDDDVVEVEMGFLGKRTVSELEVL